jgi:hypothetical protein
MIIDFFWFDFCTFTVLLKHDHEKCDKNFNFLFINDVIQQQLSFGC